MRNDDRGLFRPPNSPNWWVRFGVNGKTIRKSAHTDDIEVARAVRRQMMEQLSVRVVDRDWREFVDAQLADSESWLRRTASRIRRKAAARGWSERLSLDELTQLMIKSGGKCAITGIPFNRVADKRDPYAISIDRVDSSKGYSAGNARLVLLAVNLAMSHWGEVALIRISKAIAGQELLKSVHAKGIPVLTDT
jgi:capsid protein